MRHRTRTRALKSSGSQQSIPAILPCVVYAAQPHHPNQDLLDIERAEIGTECQNRNHQMVIGGCVQSERPIFCAAADIHGLLCQTVSKKWNFERVYVEYKRCDRRYLLDIDNELFNLRCCNVSLDD